MTIASWASIIYAFEEFSTRPLKQNPTGFLARRILFELDRFTLLHHLGFRKPFDGLEGFLHLFLW